MKKYKLKKQVKSMAIICSLSLFIIGGVYFSKIFLNNKKDDIQRVSRDIVTNDVKPVMEEVKEEKASKPFDDLNVKETKSFYENEGNEENQEKSLLFYKNTYMQNSGVLYTNENSFDIVSVLDGNVTSITKDDILGNVVEITHSNDLITIYQTLGEVNVKVGDHVKKNDKIGISGNVNIDQGYKNSLLFEVNYKGKVINPNKFYEMKINDLIN